MTIELNLGAVHRPARSAVPRTVGCVTTWRTVLVLAAIMTALALSGCAQSSSTGSSPAAAAHTRSTHHQSARYRHAHHKAARHRRAHRKPVRHRPTARKLAHHRHVHHRAPVRAAAGALAVSSASGSTVQPQPTPGSCHATGSGEYSEPDAACTPGALNPAVTQATIGQTICVSGYTTNIRPSTSITDPEKLASMAAYGDGTKTSAYEYDHLISLELGGAVNDPRNLWPEPGASPNPKDSVENTLHAMVCDGQIRLAHAQHIIATRWVQWDRAHSSSDPGESAPADTTTTSPPTSSGTPNKPVSEVNCSDFSTHAAAQQWFDGHGGSATNDVAGLDGNADGVACSSLP
jgi:hypothetical protein